MQWTGFEPELLQSADTRLRPLGHHELMEMVSKSEINQVRGLAGPEASRPAGGHMPLT